MRNASLKANCRGPGGEGAPGRRALGRVGASRARRERAGEIKADARVARTVVSVAARRVGSAARQNKALARRVTPPRPPPPRSLALRRSLVRSPLDTSDTVVHRRRSRRFRVRLSLGVSRRIPRESVRYNIRRESGPSRAKEVDGRAPNQPRDTTQTMLRRAYCQSMRRAVAPNKEIPLSPLLFQGDVVCTASSSVRTIRIILRRGRLVDDEGSTWIAAEKCVGRGSRLI